MLEKVKMFIINAFKTVGKFIGTPFYGMLLKAIKVMGALAWPFQKTFKAIAMVMTYLPIIWGITSMSNMDGLLVLVEKYLQDLLKNISTDESRKEIQDLLKTIADYLHSHDGFKLSSRQEITNVFKTIGERVHVWQ